MPLHLHRAERTDRLADQLGELLALPPGDPFAQEVVVVPAKGVERWLTQRLSHRLGTGARGGDGVCAGVRFLNPHSLVAMLLGKDHDDPWQPDRMVWPLLETIDASLDEPWCATLAAHLGHRLDGLDGELRRSRRFSVARRLAGLFDSYAVQRPHLLADWREGRDTDGAGGTLDADLSWQAELWRHLLAHVGVEPPDVRHTSTLTRIATGDAELDLPDRLSLFGHTRLARTEVELLAALGDLRDVHLWLPQPSPVLWEALTGPQSGLAGAGPVPRAEDTSARLAHHPLLISLGRDARELPRTLAVAGRWSEEPAPAPAATPGTLLGWLQHDLRSDAEPDAATVRGRVVAADDATVQVHACHGAARQVDVLREVLVGLLAGDPTLEPRDILVMCPDIETYAPLVQAGFGLGEAADGAAHPAHRLRVLLADRAPSATNPVLAVAADLVRLAGGRVSATDLLGLLAHPPVQRRFALSTDDLDRVRGWIDRSGIRWGLDAGHRQAYAVRHVAQNTWRFGVDRVLAGAALPGDDRHRVGTALPLDDVDDLDLAGRFAELVDRVHRSVTELSEAEAVADWMQALADAVAGLTEVAPADAWQVAQFDRELARTLDAAGPGQLHLRLADVRVLLEQRLAGRPTRANFRTGTLTVCTMVPMRSVPHRVVCLLGLDDGTFPRSTATDGDDVLARRPLTGERDLRSEDRQLLLDAILAATERLVITYTGADPHTGAHQPPAVPLGEIIDALHATATFPDDDRTSHDAGPGPGEESDDATRPGPLVRRHPLQPFDARNFGAPAQPGEPPTEPFSFDRPALAGAQAARAPRVAARTLMEDPLPAHPPADLTLTDLQEFFASPARHFLRRRLDVALPLPTGRARDAIPITLDALERWGVGDRLLRGIRSGLSPDQAIQTEQLRGMLPPGELFGPAMREICTGVQGLLTATADLIREPERSLDVDIDLGGGRRLTGTVTGIHDAGVVSVTYSRLQGKQRLASWITLLSLTLGRPGTWTGYAVGRGRRDRVQVAQTGGLDDSALTHLIDLVEVYDRGQREPLPLPPATAAAYAVAWGNAAGPTDPALRWAAREVWETGDNPDLTGPGEQDQPEHVRVYGARAPVEVLLGRPRRAERWNDATTRLGQYALRVWQPLLRHERLVQR